MWPVMLETTSTTRWVNVVPHSSCSVLFLYVWCPAVCHWYGIVLPWIQLGKSLRYDRQLDQDLGVQYTEDTATSSVAILASQLTCLCMLYQQAKDIVVCAGSRPASMPIPGAELCINYNEALALPVSQWCWCDSELAYQHSCLCGYCV